MSIEAKNVSMMINEKPLLTNVSLSCEPGTVLGIIGENGAGKSTLLNALAGLTPPTRGETRLNGTSLAQLSVRSMSKVRAVLPQNSELSFPLDAIEVVRLALSLSTYPPESQDKLLSDCMERFNVLALAERNYLTLSGGERQRVQLARVTAQLLCQNNQTSQYLLLDEPISALDLYQQYQTLQSIRQLAKNGVGVIAILHDLNLASLYCDHIAILKNGELLNVGTPGDVITQSSIMKAFNIDVTMQQHPDTHTPYLTPRVK